MAAFEPGLGWLRVAVLGAAVGSGSVAWGVIGILGGKALIGTGGGSSSPEDRVRKKANPPTASNTMTPITAGVRFFCGQSSTLAIGATPLGFARAGTGAATIDAAGATTGNAGTVLAGMVGTPGVKTGGVGGRESRLVENGGGGLGMGAGGAAFSGSCRAKSITGADGAGGRWGGAAKLGWGKVVDSPGSTAGADWAFGRCGGGAGKAGARAGATAAGNARSSGS